MPIRRGSASRGVTAMEVKWLEDFVSLAQTGNFSRSAVERNVTQSAFSRRIQALENWLGVSVVDRSTYPTTLTGAGREFRETAEEVLRMLHGSRANLQAFAKPNRQTVAVAALHTLALTFFPKWFRDIETDVGAINSRLLPNNFHNCIQALVEGGYDFLLTFYHPSVPILLDSAQFLHRVIGEDRLVAVHAAGLPHDGETLPLLSYAQGSFLGKVTAFAQARANHSPADVVHTNENAMAEALKFMALEGHGLAWLPRSLVRRELAEGRLTIVGEETPLEVRLYRNAGHQRGIVAAVWDAAERHAARQTMRDGNEPDRQSIGRRVCLSRP